MPIIFIFIFWYMAYGRNNPNIYSKIHDKLGLIIVLGIIFSGVLSSISSLLPLMFGISIVLLVMFGPLALIVSLLMKSTKGKKRQQQSDYTYYQQHYSQPNANNGTTVTGLTRAVPKRRKIIQKFNQKYELLLTEEQINRIVDASYMSNCWEREIFDMSQKYDTIAQWYRGDSAWLRAYLHAFPVQNVTSDFENQKAICLNAFYQIFSEVNPEKYVSVEDCVTEINNRFMTNFDEMTFTIAHRFLHEQGYSFAMPHYDVHGTKSDIDMLKEKYDKEVHPQQQQQKMRL